MATTPVPPFANIDPTFVLHADGTFSAAGGGGSVTNVTATAPLASSGGATPDISITLPSDATKYLDGTGNFTVPAGSGGTVTSVATTAPITGGTITTTGTIAVSTMTGDSGSGGATGVVPAPASGDAAAGKFLKADATWAVPPGSGTGAMTLISSNVLSGAAASFSFTSISGSYNHLQLIVVGRTSAASAQDARIQFNGDTTGNTNYSDQFDGANGTTQQAGQAQSQVAGRIGLIGSATQNSNSFGVLDCFIPCYALTTFHKGYMSKNYGLVAADGSGEAYDLMYCGRRKNTAAITQIDVTLSSGNWVTGSAAYLYGIT